MRKKSWEHLPTDSSVSVMDDNSFTKFEDDVGKLEPVEFRGRQPDETEGDGVSAHERLLPLEIWSWVDSEVLDTSAKCPENSKEEP